MLIQLNIQISEMIIIFGFILSHAIICINNDYKSFNICILCNYQGISIRISEIDNSFESYLFTLIPCIFSFSNIFFVV